MNFEAALREELTSIDGLDKKVLPLVGSEGTKTPYIIYISNYGLRDKTLNGYEGSRELNCELNIIEATYGKMKSLTDSVIDKILTFQSRVIGTDGPYIQNVSYMDPVEIYEELPKLFRCNINFKFHF